MKVTSITRDVWLKSFYILNFIIALFRYLLWQEANEAGALRLAKNKLEKQLEDLTWRLHLEKRLRVILVTLGIGSLI